MFTDVIYTNITYFKLQVSVPLLFIKLSLFFFIELFSILHLSNFCFQKRLPKFTQKSFLKHLIFYKISLVYLLNASCTARINIPAQSVQPSGITSRLKPSILVGIPLSSAVILISAILSGPIF
jgi:hypothetical protein